VRWPAASTASTAPSTAAASAASPRLEPQQHGSAQNGRQRVGDARPAMSGAEPWIGSYRPGGPLPNEADGSIPIEPAAWPPRPTNVAEHILGGDYVEIGRAADEIHGGRRLPARLRRSRRDNRGRLVSTSRHSRDEASTLAYPPRSPSCGAGAPGRRRRAQPLDLDFAVAHGIHAARPCASSQRPCGCPKYSRRQLADE